jgi:hypothetical protein
MCLEKALISLDILTLPSQWFLAPARLYAYQLLLQIAQILMFRRKSVLWSALFSASENSIADIRHMNNEPRLYTCQLHFLFFLFFLYYKTLFYVNYTLIVVYTMLSVTSSQSKKCLLVQSLKWSYWVLLMESRIYCAILRNSQHYCYYWLVGCLRLKTSIKIIWQALTLTNWYRRKYSLNDFVCQIW